MTTPEQDERIRDVVDRLLDHTSRNALAFAAPRLDTSRPNIHDSKAEFQAELQVVQEAIDNLHAAYKRLAGPADEDSAERKAMLARLRANIDQNARNRLAGVSPKSALDLIRKSKAEVGLYTNSLWALYDLITSLEDRRSELKSQEKEFWTIKNRAPNYYARAIAQRLARIYARDMGKRPTFGTARDGGHPSTDFGRALEEVFSIIGVRANVRRAAEWAINELTENDLQPYLLGSILGTARSDVVPKRIPRGILGALSKRPGS